jgi:hypothetical protein
MEDTELRERLESLADRTAPPPRDAEELTSAVVARNHARRRREWTLAAVAAVLAAVIVVPLVVSGTAQESAPAAPAPSSAAVYTTPTRGGLSHDGAFVDGLRRLPWTTGPGGAGVPEPPLDTRHVVWAGIVSGGRSALVAGADPDQPLPPDEDGDGRPDLDQLDSVAIAWFRGPTDATAEQMTLHSVPRIVAADEPTALTNSATGVAVIVGAPGDRIETSGLVRVGSDGTPSREYGARFAPEGIAITDPWDVEASIDRSVRYRVTRGSTVFEGEPDAYPNPDHVPPEVELAQLRPAPPPAPGYADVAAAIDDLLSRTGVAAESLSFTVLWAGDLPSVVSETAPATVLAVRFPSGAIYVGGILGQEGLEGPFGVLCGSELRAAAPVEQLVVVLHCSSAPPADPPDAGERLVVVGPPEATTARVLDAQGQVLGSNPMVDGVAVVPMPDDLATVEVLDAGGVILDARAPVGVADLSGD